MPQIKLPAWTELHSMKLVLDKEKFLEKYFGNVLSLKYLPTAS